MYSVVHSVRLVVEYSAGRSLECSCALGGVLGEGLDGAFGDVLGEMLGGVLGGTLVEDLGYAREYTRWNAG